MSENFKKGFWLIIGAIFALVVLLCVVQAIRAGVAHVSYATAWKDWSWPLPKKIDAGIADEVVETTKSVVRAVLFK